MLLERLINIMKEYRVMYNSYDGKGDKVYTVTDDPVLAIEYRYSLNENVVNNQGKAWIEMREVSQWKIIKEIR